MSAAPDLSIRRGRADTDARADERAVLGSAMVDAEAAALVCRRLVADHFEADGHRVIFGAVAALVEDGDPVDVVTVVRRMGARASEVGGLDYVTDLADIATGANAAVYVRLLEERHEHRRTLEAARIADPQVRREALRRIIEETPASGRDDQPILLRLDQVQPERIRWLCQGWIPQRKFGVLDGDPGSGKSSMTIGFAAAISTGCSLLPGIGGDLTEPAGVVMLSAEDDPADTIRPRLDAAGADVSRVHLLSMVRRAGITRGVTLQDVTAIRMAIKETAARLVIIDPLPAYTSGTDTHRDDEIRQLLAPLAAMAHETGATVLAVRHLRKGTGGNPIYAGGGSIGIIGAARFALLAARDPDDPTGQRRVLTTTKHNLAPPPEAMAYEIEAINDVPRIKWLGPSEHTAATLIADPGDSDTRSALDEAKEWLRDRLATGMVPTVDVVQEAKGVGISQRTLARAKKTLGVRSEARGTGPGRWHLYLPDDEAADQGCQDPRGVNLGSLGKDSKNSTTPYAYAQDRQDCQDCQDCQRPIDGLPPRRGRP